MMNARRIIIACVALILLMLPGAAFADTVIQVRPGLNGIYKYSQPVELNIAIAHQGPAIENALLVVKLPPEDEFRRAYDYQVYQKKIQIPANQRIEVSLTVPGEFVNNQPKVYLVVDGVEVASTPIQGLSVGGELVGISIGDKALSGGMPSWADSNLGYMMGIKYMAPLEIPTNIMALRTADLIVLDSEGAGELTPAQIETIYQWVALGGVLVLSEGAGAREGQPFADISPVLVKGSTTVNSNWNELRADTSPIPVALGTLVEGTVLVKHQEIPLLANRSIGRGTVIYSAAGLEHITSKDAGVWSTIFQQHNIGELNKYYTGRMLHGSLNLPQLQMPSVKLMAVVWGIYILLVAPGLYLLLKRYNRRDWAWFCIPAVALVAASVMYYSAPFHKIKGPLGNTLAVVEILNENTAEIIADGTFVSPRGGNLSLTDSGNGVIHPQFRYYHRGNEGPPVVEFTGEGHQIVFPHVEFWSMRQASSYKVVDNMGMIDGELKLNGNNITGTLVNNTGIDIKRCLAVIGESSIEIGELPAGGTVNINTDLRNIKSFSWERDVDRWFNSFEMERAEYHHKISSVPIMGMEKHYSDPYGQSTGIEGIQLIGYAEKLPGLMELEQANAQNYHSVMIRQSIKLSLSETGEFILPPGIIRGQLFDFNGGIHHTPEGYRFEGGQLSVEYNLNLPVKNREVEYRNIKITNLMQEYGYSVLVYDWSNNKWIDLEPGQFSVKGDELKGFISEHNRIRFNIKPEGHPAKPIPMPAIQVEGVVK